MTNNYFTRAQQANDLHSQVLRMLRQNVETLGRAMSHLGLPLDHDALEPRVAAVPALGLSTSGDECHVAESRLLGLVTGLVDDLEKLVAYAETGPPFPELQVDQDSVAMGRRLGELRREAGVSVESMAERLSVEPGEPPRPSGWVEGVESGRFAISNNDVGVWAAACGSTTAAVWSAEAGRPLSAQDAALAGWIDDAAKTHAR